MSALGICDKLKGHFLKLSFFLYQNRTSPSGHPTLKIHLLLILWNNKSTELNRSSIEERQTPPNKQPKTGVVYMRIIILLFECAAMHKSITDLRLNPSSTPPHCDSQHSPCIQQHTKILSNPDVELIASPEEGSNVISIQRRDKVTIALARLSWSRYLNKQRFYESLVTVPTTAIHPVRHPTYNSFTHYHQSSPHRLLLFLNVSDVTELNTVTTKPMNLDKQGQMCRSFLNPIGNGLVLNLSWSCCHFPPTWTNDRLSWAPGLAHENSLGKRFRLLPNYKPSHCLLTNSSAATSVIAPITMFLLSQNLRGLAAVSAPEASPLIQQVPLLVIKEIEMELLPSGHETTWVSGHLPNVPNTRS